MLNWNCREKTQVSLIVLNNEATNEDKGDINLRECTKINVGKIATPYYNKNKVQKYLISNIEAIIRRKQTCHMSNDVMTTFR